MKATLDSGVDNSVWTMSGTSAGKAPGHLCGQLAGDSGHLLRSFHGCAHVSSAIIVGDIAGPSRLGVGMSQRMNADHLFLIERLERGCDGLEIGLELRQQDIFYRARTALSAREFLRQPH